MKLFEQGLLFAYAIVIKGYGGVKLETKQSEGDVFTIQLSVFSKNRNIK